MKQTRLSSIVAIVILGAACSSYAAAPQRSASVRPSASSADGGYQAGVAVDITYASSESDMVRSSALVIVGSPAGDPEVDLLADGKFADYYQTVRIESTVGRDISSKTIRIVWLGVAPALSALNVDIDSRPLGEILKPGSRYVLFLQPSSADGVYALVGHTQGILQLDAAGRTELVGEHGFGSLEGLDLDRLASAIQAFRS